MRKTTRLSQKNVISKQLLPSWLIGTFQHGILARIAQAILAKTSAEMRQFSRIAMTTLSASEFCHRSRKRSDVRTGKTTYREIFSKSY